MNRITFLLAFLTLPVPLSATAGGEGQCGGSGGGGLVTREGSAGSHCGGVYATSESGGSGGNCGGGYTPGEGGSYGNASTTES